MRSGKTQGGVLYAVKQSSSSVAYCALSIRCGTRDEKGYSNGISHFTEHTIFKGTLQKRASVINGYLEKSGGEINAYTTKEEIVIHTTVLKEDLRKAASLLLELATSATFPQKEIRTERGVIIDEIKSYRDMPSEDIYDRFEEMIFEGHPLEKPILGTVESVQNIDSEELQKFVKEKFVPEAMAFTVVADIEEKKLEKMVVGILDSVFNTVAERKPVAGMRPEDKSSYFQPEIKSFETVIDKDNHEVNAVIGALAPSLYSGKSRISTILMSNILAGPASNSILNSILREKNGWVYNVESNYTQYSDTGLFTISLGCDKENLDKCLKSVNKEILKLQTIPLTDNKLKAAKKQLKGQMAISSDNGESQCLSFGKSLLAYGTVLSDDEIRDMIESVTSADIQDVAKEIFRPEKVCKLIYL